MKYKIMIIGILLCMPFFKAQSQTRIKKFCELSVTIERSDKVGISIDYGQTEYHKLFRDSIYMRDLNKVAYFDTMVKALNYMTKMGWKYEWNVPGGGLGQPWYYARIMFSREFDVSELTDDNN